MVYESDFYTTRRPYRVTSPSISTYSVTTPSPSRQVRILPGLGKVHVVHTYDRIVPYVGHKRLTVVTSNPMIYKVRPSILYKEYDRIENKYRPITYASALNEYLNSQSAVRYYVRYPYTYSYTPSYYYTIYRPYYSTYYTNNIVYTSNPDTGVNYFTVARRPIPYVEPRTPTYARNFDDETRLIKAETASLLKRIHSPIPRTPRALPLPYISRYDDYPTRTISDDYIYRMAVSSARNPKVIAYTTYYTEPVRKYFGQGQLACISFAGDKVHPRRRNVYVYEDPVRNDIQLLSYYIAKFRQEKPSSVSIKELPSAQILPAARPSRIFTSTRIEREKKRVEQLSRPIRSPADEEAIQKAQQRRQEEAKLAAEKAEAEEAAKREAESKRIEAARLAEIARQEELAAKAAAEKAAAEKAAAEKAAAEKAAAEKAAAEKAAELERQAEKARQEELAKQAEIEKARKAEEERLRLEEEKRLAEEARLEEERQQLLRLEEIARQAEEERERELARQAEELAELARQEAELAELAKQQEEEEAKRKKEEADAEIAKQEAELAELERQEKELAELARQEAELAEQAKLEAAAAEEAAAPSEEAAPEEAPAAAEEPAAEEAPAEESAAAEESEPIVEEPETPEAAQEE